MATLQDNGYFYCRTCKRDQLTRNDFYTDRSKAYELSGLCKLCESERTKEPKRRHYLRSERRRQARAKKSKETYYFKKRDEILRKSAEYKERHPWQARGYRYKQKYQLTLEERAAMIEELGGCCAICGAYQGDRLEIDHDHDTGKVRSMLCHLCNSGLGMFQDNEELLAIARLYLQHHRD